MDIQLKKIYKFCEQNQNLEQNMMVNNGDIQTKTF